MQKSLRMTQVTWICTVFLHHWMAIIHYNNWLRINRLLTNARNGDMQKSLLLCKKVKENLQCYLFITALVLLLTTKSELDSWASSSSQMPEVEKYCRNLCNLQEHDIASKSKESNVTSSQYSGVLEVSPCGVHAMPWHSSVLEETDIQPILHDLSCTCLIVLHR